MERRAESLEDVYHSVFGSDGAATLSVRETPSREGKDYALTRERFHEKKRALVKTIAAIANAGSDVGYIIFQGSQLEEPAVDLADVDNALRARVYPRVAVEHERRVIKGRVIDFLRIPRSVNRPHLMLTDSHEMVVPFRGAANNITAARHEIDAMYDERTLQVIRRALSVSLAPSIDTVEEFLDEWDWGDVSSSSDPQFVFAIVPLNQEHDVFGGFLESRDAHAVLHNLWLETIEKDERTDWFSPHGDFVTGRRDGYTEVYQPAVNGHRIGTLLLYDVGAVIARVWILEPDVEQQPIFSDLHFVHALYASLKFAWRTYEHGGYPDGEVEIRCMLANAQHINMWLMPSIAPNRRILWNRDVGRRLAVPKRPVRIDPHGLGHQAQDIASRVGRALRAHYDAKDAVQ